MDVHSAAALAAARRADLTREAGEFRLARLVRESRETPKPVPKPAPGVVRARLLGVAR
ncbi:hypothetical protein [Actinophytocola glycyrrhizae]|uniref:Uncharacterized protein n=1 Tax=Actinophytocola glycyrrhizae TaxID=2044873 RepID=A0ABV9SG10_9PSEU